VGTVILADATRYGPATTSRAVCPGTLTETEAVCILSCLSCLKGVLSCSTEPFIITNLQNRGTLGFGGASPDV
jgi:hypothetical protein